MRPTGWLLPVPQAPWLKLRFVAVVAKLFGALSGGAGPEGPATLGAELFGTAVGTIGGNKEDTFHKGFLPWWRLRCPLRSASWPSQERGETPAGECPATDTPKRRIANAWRMCKLAAGAGRKGSAVSQSWQSFRFFGLISPHPDGLRQRDAQKILVLTAERRVSNKLTWSNPPAPRGGQRRRGGWRQLGNSWASNLGGQ